MTRLFCALHGDFTDHTAEACDLPSRTVTHTLTILLPASVTDQQIENAAAAAFVQWDEPDDDHYADDPDAPPFRTFIIGNDVLVDHLPIGIEP